MRDLMAAAITPLAPDSLRDLVTSDTFEFDIVFTSDMTPEFQDLYRVPYDHNSSLYQRLEGQGRIVIMRMVDMVVGQTKILNQGILLWRNLKNAIILVAKAFLLTALQVNIE